MGSVRRPSASPMELPNMSRTLHARDRDRDDSVANAQRRDWARGNWKQRMRAKARDQWDEVLASDTATQGLPKRYQ